MAAQLPAFKALTLARKAIGPLTTDRVNEINVISLLADDSAACGMADPLTWQLSDARHLPGLRRIACPPGVEGKGTERKPLALDGTTIELINTDAEGRMVLSDTLALVCREKPRAIIDYATLTGGVVAALGQRMGGAITNRGEWIEPIIQAGERCGERVWPFPYEDDYDEDLQSTVADTLQCRTMGAGDHIYAARLLGRFVDKDIG